MDADTNSRRVLVVDDEALLRWSVAETLSDHGFQVVESSDAQGARCAVRDASRDFDAVLLDLQLPDSVDLSLLRTLRVMAPKTPLILMTAFGTPELVQDALHSGAYRVLDKPFEIEALATLVSEATAGPAGGVSPAAAN
jgi:DNA-binding NtrC family response regulator